MATDAGDKIVYHYTTLDALLSIMQKNALWATHIRYMNDTSEQNLLWNLLRRRLEERFATEDGPKQEQLTVVRQFLENPRQLDIYAVCFSEDGGNRLSQWRGYSEGKGVSIGFKVSELNEFCKGFSMRWRTQHTDNPFGGASLHQVSYIDGKGQTIPAIDQMLDLIDVKLNASLAISLMAATVKHIAFEEEREWRIMLRDHVYDHPVQYRTRRSMLVPYRELALRPKATQWIHNVVIGPSPHQKENAESVKRMTGLSDEQIVLSDMPFRDW